LEDGDKILWVDLEAHTAWSTAQTSVDESQPSPLQWIPEHLHKFSDVFLKEGFDKLSPHHE